MTSPLDPKYRTSRHNELLDLSVPTVKFNVDHLYKLPQTTRSFVFFPYYVNVDEIDEFNKYCKSNHYRIKFVGGESVYGGNTYDVTRNNLIGTNGTMTILLIHEDDDKKEKFEIIYLNLSRVSTGHFLINFLSSSNSVSSTIPLAIVSKGEYERTTN